MQKPLKPGWTTAWMNSPYAYILAPYLKSINQHFMLTFSSSSLFATSINPFSSKPSTVFMLSSFSWTLQEAWAVVNISKYAAEPACRAMTVLHTSFVSGPKPSERHSEHSVREVQRKGVCHKRETWTLFQKQSELNSYLHRNLGLQILDVCL